VPVDGGGAVVQVRRVLWREDERALSPSDLVEEVVVVVVVQPVLHQLAAHPHVGHLQRGGGQRGRQTDLSQQPGQSEEIHLRQVGAEGPLLRARPGECEEV
jgi:hypothetical protein